VPERYRRTYSLAREAFVNASKLLTSDELAYRRMLASASSSTPSYNRRMFTELEDVRFSHDTRQQHQPHHHVISSFAGPPGGVLFPSGSPKIIAKGLAKKAVKGFAVTDLTRGPFLSGKNIAAVDHVRKKKSIGAKLGALVGLKLFFKGLFCNPIKCCIKYKLMPKKLFKIPCCIKKKIWCCICIIG
jgi:hypothetical protein